MYNYWFLPVITSTLLPVRAAGHIGQRTLCWNSAQSFEIIYRVAHETDYLFRLELLSAHVDDSTHRTCFIKMIYGYDMSLTELFLRIVENVCVLSSLNFFLIYLRITI